MDKYSRGKIYLIRNKNNENLIYVGSTIEIYLSKRFQKHKSHRGCSLYEYINNLDNNTNWNEWYIELYEEYPCENRLQLCKRENEIIREKATINKFGYKTDKMRKEYDKEYREKNKDKRKEYYKEYREKNKEYYKEYCEKNKDKRKENDKEYREKNKEYYKEYREKNKEYYKEYREKNKEKITCECGCEITKYNLSKHNKTKKHINFLNNTPF